MRPAEDSLVSLDDAHEVLGTFGIGTDNRAYQRWKQPEGFKLADFENVLNESPLVLAVDWRECLEDALETMSTQLASFQIQAVLGLDEGGNQGHVKVHGHRVAVKYTPNDGDNFDLIIGSINELIGSRAQYRKLRACVGTDGWSYGLLSNEKWDSLESRFPELVRRLFVTGSKVTVVEGDLLDQEVDAIVNAWNRNVIPWWLLLPQGASGAIKKRGGTGPFKELRKFGAIPLGRAVLTSAGKLPFKGIIHVAGINLLWRASERSIRDSVRNALAVAEEHGFQSIAFPLIGAGSGGFNQEKAERIMLDELQKWESPLAVTVVVFRGRSGSVKNPEE